MVGLATIKKHKKGFSYLSTCKTKKLRHAYLNKASPAFISCIGEVCKNVLYNKNVRIKQLDRNRLKRNIPFLIKLSGKATSGKLKRRALSQVGGGIFTTLWNIVKGAIENI